jgi:hypothetical protein
MPTKDDSVCAQTAASIHSVPLEMEVGFSPVAVCRSSNSRITKRLSLIGVDNMEICLRVIEEELYIPRG